MQGVFAQIGLGGDQIADDGLLGFDGLAAIDDQEIEIRAHRQVLFQNAALENPEAFVRIGGKAQIHSGLEILQLRTAIENALQGSLQRRFEEKDHVGHGGKIIDAAHPFRGAAANGVAGERGENVAIAQNEIAGAQERKELAFVAVGKIGGVDEAEGGRGEEFALFSFAGGVLDEGRGIPFAEENFKPLKFQPAFEEVDLGGFARAVWPCQAIPTPR